MKVGGISGRIPDGEVHQCTRTGTSREGNLVGEHFWTRGYAVSTVGFELEQEKAYIRAQEAEDEE